MQRAWFNAAGGQEIDFPAAVIDTTDGEREGQIVFDYESSFDPTLIQVRTKYLGEDWIEWALEEISSDQAATSYGTLLSGTIIECIYDTELFWTINVV